MATVPTAPEARCPNHTRPEAYRPPRSRSGCARCRRSERAQDQTDAQISPCVRVIAQRGFLPSLLFAWRSRSRTPIRAGPVGQSFAQAGGGSFLSRPICVSSALAMGRLHR